MAKKKAIGIDLGTSKCCVGVVRDGKVEILENERGNKTTPSYVAFTDTERLVGEDAKDQATLNPVNTVFGVKRIIGREWKDVSLKGAVDKMPYTIMNKNEERVCINLSYKKVEESLLPQQITAMLLGKMKDLAKHHLKCEVEEAVISVPASFSNAQRQATKDAAAIAGLKVLALINEPTAAAIAYQANRRKTDEENVAVVDFGAGKLDVAIVTVCKGRVCVRAVSGSTAIGGDDMDEILMEYVSRKFENINGRKLLEGSAITERLRPCCEKLKRKLTLLPKVQETLDCFGDDNILHVNIKRDDFNAMIPSEMQSTLKNCLDRAMQASRLPLQEISRVVLVGGSSRIPLFQTTLEGFFGKNLLDKSVNPDEAVTYGATRYAAFLCGDNELEEFKLDDSVPNDYCFSSKGDSSMQPVFDKHSNITLPRQRMYPFKGLSPFNENTRKQKFEFYEELLGQKNPHRLIGTLCLDEEFRQAVSLITDVTFVIDRCGIFNAVVQLKPNHTFPQVLKNYAGKLNKDQLQNVTEREQQFRKDDQDERERMEAMSGLEALSFRLHKAMNDGMVKELFPEIVKVIIDEAKENLQWLDANNTAPKAEYVKRLKILENLENDLESKIDRYKEEENDRLAAVMNLESYCSFLKTSVATDMADETELVAALGELLKEATEWLKRSERPSRKDCNDRKEGLKKVQVEIERKLEIKRREKDRRAAIDNLQSYCSKIQDMKYEGKELDSSSYHFRRLTEENLGCMKYLREIEVPSKVECESRKQRLEKMVCDAEKEVERRRASQLESERQAAITRLRRRCSELECLARSIPYNDNESHPVATLGTETLNETRRWLSGPKTVTKEECDAQQKIIDNYLNTLTELKERDRHNCIGYCKSHFAYVEQTWLVDLSWKKEPELCKKVIQKKNELFRYLETEMFSRKDYERKLATFDTAFGTLKNKMKIKYSNDFKNCV